MKFREIFRFEFLYQVRRIRTWFYFAVLFAAAYGLVRTDGSSGDVAINTPFDVAEETILTSLLWVLIAPAVAGSAAARDVQTRMHPLVYAAPIHKIDYLGGRFLAAFVLNALLLLAVPLGTLVAVYLSGREPALVAPLRPAVYLSSYGVLALPTCFLFTTIQFSFAALTRRPMVAYLGTVLFFFTLGATIGVVTNVLQMPTLGKLLDPTCRMEILILMGDTMTPLEKNTLLFGLKGSILANRLLWIGIGLAVLAFTHTRFRFGERAA